MFDVVDTAAVAQDFTILNDSRRMQYGRITLK